MIILLLIWSYDIKQERATLGKALGRTIKLYIDKTSDGKWL